MTTPMNPTPSSTRAPAVLVLGAQGRLGAAAVQAFHAAGWRVIAQVRREPTALPAGVQLLRMPLADTAGLAIAAAGVRAVVHAVNPPYTAWQSQLLPMARLGMDLAQRLGALFMLPGNVYAFGHPMPAVLREDTPQRPSSRKGQIRQQLEAEMAERAPSGLRSVVIRAGDFFGGGSGSWFDLAILKSVGRGRLVYPGPMDVPHAWAYLPDLARAFVAAAAHDDLPPAAVLHFAGHTCTGAQLLDAIERSLQARGRAPARGLRRGGMPWAVIRAGGLFVPIWRELAEMAYLWHDAHALDGTRLRGCLGALPGTPLDAAIDATLDGLGLAAVAGSPRLATR